MAWALLLGVGAGVLAAPPADTAAPDTAAPALVEVVNPRLLHGTDADEDTWPDTVDCAMEDPAIYPGAPELCNGLDDDCDGEIDDLEELCNGLDDDCDGQVDELAECKACGGEREREEALLLLLPLVWGRRRRG